jgi:hypothetical protein
MTSVIRPACILYKLVAGVFSLPGLNTAAARISELSNEELPAVLPSYIEPSLSK